jgi:hypothetical protein
VRAAERSPATLPPRTPSHAVVGVDGAEIVENDLIFRRISEIGPETVGPWGLYSGTVASLEDAETNAVHDDLRVEVLLGLVRSVDSESGKRDFLAS